MTVDPSEVLERLAGSVDPYLIGVRHHSSALAAAVPALLDAFAPDRVLIELPMELGPWLEWLGHPDARAPLALGAVVGSAGDIGFYPFADFSPELAAVRWARTHGVPCEPFDLPLARRGDEVGEVPARVREASALHGALLARTGSDDGEALWDRLVEGPAAGGDPEDARRAALLYGWALREDTSHARRSDLARERFMRARLAEARASGSARVAAVIGSYHGAALADPELDPLPRLDGPEGTGGPEVVTSLLPYAFEQLDSRSGYPAGIRDPLWHQRIWEARRDGRDIGQVAGEVLVSVCRRVRRARHVAGTPDASEALRLARGLADLRDLPAPGRREVLEAAQTALARGEVLGRGRVLARAMEHVLVGRNRGALAPGTPRSGLVPHVEALIAALRLPGPDDDPPREPTRLDPLRSETDRRRHVSLERFGVAGVSYGEPLPTDEDALTHSWRVGWTAATDATLAAAGMRGVTLEMATAGALRVRRTTLEAEERLSAGARVELLESAAACGLPELVAEGLTDVRTTVVDEAGLVELVGALRVVERIAAGHVPGCPLDGEDARVVRDEPGAVPTLVLPDGALALARDELLAASVRAVDGLAGATELTDVRALVALARVFELAPERLGDGRLLWSLRTLAESGSPRVQGGAVGALVLLGSEEPSALGARMGGWIDACADAGARTTLAGRLQGVLTAVGPHLEGNPALAVPLIARVATLDDDAFLTRLPALREGFDVLSPAARERLLHEVLERLPSGGALSDVLSEDPALLARFAEADRAAAAALEAAGLTLVVEAPAPDGSMKAPPAEAPEPLGIPEAPGALGNRDRWRLVLGRQRDRLSQPAGRYARALDELYGRGRGEGSRHGPSGGGSEEPFPSVREWGDELGELFGGSVREEVLGRAAERGDLNAVLELDPETVRPSVELLEAVLSLKGGMSEAQLTTLRRLVDRVLAQLVEALAVQVRPALHGMAIPRPTRRRTDRLDLRRTVRANLHTARHDGERLQLVPERLVFRSRARRSMDWRVVLVVDTSGSMDANIIHAAMMAAILSRLPAVSVSFLAFSTKVVDLTDRADDPLALLLEVQVGGGTDIGKAVRYGRQLVTAPTRTLFVVVSDFEEGASVGRLLGEVRALVESGVKALGLAALDERARPNYNVAIAQQLASLGMPVAALTPLELARWVGEQIRGST